MTDWGTVVLTLGASVIAILGTLAGVWLQHAYARGERELVEQKELRERGAAVLTPISSLLSECPPSEVLISASALVGAAVLTLEKLATVDERVPAATDALMAYANAHPMPEMADAALQLATATKNAVRVTMWLLSEHLKVEGDTRFYLEASRSEHAHADRLLSAVLSAARGELEGASLASRIREIETEKAADDARLLSQAESRAGR